jgi:Protein of unknown function (DUF1559)
MVALLLPAVQAAREAARRTQSANSMRRHGIALHNHVDTRQTLPTGYTVSNDGKPLLSWRVTMLPYLQERELYDQFHLDEPWDSPHNKQLIQKMPNIFRSPHSTAKPGMTTYLGVGGEHGLLVAPTTPQTKNGLRFSAIPDGLSNTIMIVEASDELAVEWTKPVDFAPDPKDPLKGLLGARPSGFLATFADGSTQFISREIPAETLSALFSRDDGKKVEWPPPGPAVQKAKAASPRN